MGPVFSGPSRKILQPTEPQLGVGCRADGVLGPPVNRKPGEPTARAAAWRAQVRPATAAGGPSLWPLRGPLSGREFPGAQGVGAAFSGRGAHLLHKFLVPSVQGLLLFNPLHVLENGIKLEKLMPQTQRKAHI